MSGIMSGKSTHQVRAEVQAASVRREGQSIPAGRVPDPFEVFPYLPYHDTLPCGCAYTKHKDGSYTYYCNPKCLDQSKVGKVYNRRDGTVGFRYVGWDQRPAEVRVREND